MTNMKYANLFFLLIVLGVGCSPIGRGQRKSVSDGQPSATTNILVDNESHNKMIYCPTVPSLKRKVIRRYTSRLRTSHEGFYVAQVTSFRLESEFVFDWPRPEHGKSESVYKLEWADEYTLNNKVFAYTLFTKRIQLQGPKGQSNVSARLTAIKCVDKSGDARFIHEPFEELRIPKWLEG